MKLYEDIINDDFIDEIVESVGMATGGWDMVNPKELCIEIIRIYFEKIESYD